MVTTGYISSNDTIHGKQMQAGLKLKSVELARQQSLIIEEYTLLADVIRGFWTQRPAKCLFVFRSSVSVVISLNSEKINYNFPFHHFKFDPRAGANACINGPAMNIRREWLCLFSDGTQLLAIGGNNEYAL